jgi:hypothetical protein
MHRTDSKDGIYPCHLQAHAPELEAAGVLIWVCEPTCDWRSRVSGEKEVVQAKSGEKACRLNHNPGFRLAPEKETNTGGTDAYRDDSTTNFGGEYQRPPQRDQHEGQPFADPSLFRKNQKNTRKKRKRYRLVVIEDAYIYVVRASVWPKLDARNCKM